MKRIIRFDRAFLPTVIFSVLVVSFGIVGLVLQGFNLGVDFQAGINQYIQMAYPSMTLSYGGKGNAVLSITEKHKASLVFSGAESKTLDYDLAAIPTIDDFARKLSEVEGVKATVTDGGSLPATLIIPTFQGDFNLGTGEVILHRDARDDNEVFATIEKVRSAAAAVGTVSIQQIGNKANQQFIIRVQDDKKDPKFGQNVSASIRKALEGTFGANRVVIMKTDTVDQRYSKDLSDSAVKLVLVTLLAIMVYCAFRFKLQYAIGAILSVTHDALVMITFIVWSRMEFNTTSIAAILTILGYSINDTIVVFDRVRSERRLQPNAPFVDVMNKAITETLGRTIITTLATMLAVIALYLFTTGSLKDFSLALIVGMTTGVYSTIFIANSFVKFWDDVARKRAAKAQNHQGKSPVKPAPVPAK